MAEDNIYKEAFKSGLIKKGRTGITPKIIKKQKEAKRDFSKKYANIEESLSSGYAETTVSFADLNPYNIKRAYMNLLKNTDRKGEGNPIYTILLLFTIIWGMIGTFYVWGIKFAMLSIIGWITLGLIGLSLWNNLFLITRKKYEELDAKRKYWENKYKNLKEKSK